MSIFSKTIQAWVTVEVSLERGTDGNKNVLYMIENASVEKSYDKNKKGPNDDF